MVRIDELIHVCNILTGNFDNIATANYAIPTIWDIAKVYQRLILDILENRKTNNFVEALMEVYNNWISRKIENFNSSMYYENPEYIFQSFLNGEVLE